MDRLNVINLESISLVDLIAELKRRGILSLKILPTPEIEWSGKNVS